jgi:hypothetical protein
MARMLIVFVLVATGVNAHAISRNGRNFLGTNMRPDVVAHTLMNVEEEWRAQAAIFSQCNSTGSDGAGIVNCQDAPNSFGKSCGTVVSAIVQGSDGDRNVAKEYMSDVCSQASVTGWHKQHCQSLTQAVGTLMSADSYSNRNAFDSMKVCTGFWADFVKEEQKRLEEERLEREAAEKKAAEEEKLAKEAADKKAQEEAAEQARKAAEESKAEEARKELERIAQQKAEAEAKAKEAADRLAQKKAEAEAMAKAAQQKIEEAKEAEKEHKEALEHLTGKTNTTVETDAPKQAETEKKIAAQVPVVVPQVDNKTVGNVNQTVVTNATPVVVNQTAEAMAKAAQQKIDEAKQAEMEHKEAVAHLTEKSNTTVETAKQAETEPKTDAQAAVVPEVNGNKTAEVVNKTVAINATAAIVVNQTAESNKTSA